MNNFAISSQELATSLTKSMAALKVAGNSLEEIEALEVAGNSMVQNADVVSNSLKVLAMRLRGTTGSALEEIGEDTEGLIEDFSKLNNKVKELTKTASNPEGVSIVDKMTGGYKSTYKILLDISKVWKDIGDMQKAELLESIAGKTRATAVAAILESPDILEQAYNAAKYESAGAGDRAIEASLDSIEKKTNIIKNNFQHFSQELFESEGVKSLLDTVIEFTQNLDASKLQSLVSAIESILSLVVNIVNVIPPEGIIGAFIGAKYNMFGGLIDGLFTKMQKQTDSVAGAIEDVAVTITDTSDVTDTLTDSVAGATVGMESEAVASEGASTAIETQGKVSKATAIATGVLKAALSAVAVILITKLLSAINEWIHAEENARKELAESLRAAEERRKEFEKQQSTLDDVIAKYKEYSEQLKAVKGNEEKSAEIRDNLAGLQKTLNEQYGETVKQLDLVNGQYERELQLMELIGKQNAEEYLRNEKVNYEEWTGVSTPRLGKEYDFLKKYSLDPTELVEYGVDLNVALENYDKEMLDMLKQGGLDPFMEYSAKEFYDAIQNVLQYYYDNPEKQNEAFDKFEKEWNKYRQENETDLANMQNSANKAKYYEKIAALYGAFGDQYVQVENQLEELRKALNEEDFTKLSNLYQRYYQSVDRSGMKAEENSAFSDLYKEMANIYQQGIQDQEQYQEKAINAIFNSGNLRYFYKLPDEKLKKIVEDNIEKFGVNTQRELSVLQSAIAEGGYSDINQLFDIYQHLLEGKEDDTVKKLLSISDWYREDSSLAKDKDGNYTNKELLDLYEQTANKFKDYFEKNRNAKTEVRLSDIIDITADDELFSKLEMPNYEDFQAELVDQTSNYAISQYLDVAKEKIKELFSDDLDPKYADMLIEKLQIIKYEAMGLEEAFNVQTIEDSYIELNQLLDEVKNGKTWGDFSEFDVLLSKFPELQSAIKQVNGEYTIQETAIENLIGTYGDYSNAAINALRTARRETLDTAIATMKLGLSLSRILEIYQDMRNNQYIDPKAFGDRTWEIIKAIQDWELDDAELAKMIKEDPYHYKNGSSSDKDGSGKGDKDNKSRYDWLDSYLDKRNRQLQKEETLYENLGKQTVEDIEKQLDAYSKGGNVNLKLRPEIDAEELNKQGYDAGEGYATIFSQTFSNEAKTVAVNFTPIIVDPKTGEYLGVMEKGEFEKYCQDVIDGTRADDLNLQIGTEFTGKDAIDQAETAARKIHYLHEQLHADSDIELLYNYRQNQSLEEQNHLLDEQIKAYSRAEKQYGKRMQKGLLVDDMMKAFGNDKGKVDELIQKIIDRESINLEELTSDQASAVTAMAENFNKKLEAADKVLEAQNKKRENNLKMFTNNIEYITQKYDHVLNEFAQRQSELEHYQTMRTNAGMMENQKLYVALLDNESRELDQNIQKRNDLIEELKDFEVQSEDDLMKWYETKDAIDSTTQAIWENQEAIESYKMSMQQLSWDLDDKIMEIVGNVRNESDFLIDVLGTFEKDMYSYTREYLGNDAEKTKIYSGELSDQGLATLALKRMNAKTYREQIESLNEKIKDAQNLYLQDTTKTTYLERVEKLTKDRQDLIKSYNDEREAIVQLVQEGYDKQLESLDAISNKYIEALESERALYQYQKGLAKQTKNIANIRKQIAAYESGADTSEEARMKLQQLQISLEEAEEGLADTQNEHAIEQQRQILDHVYEALSDHFSDLLENPTKILKSTEAIVNTNMGAIKETLSGMLSFYGTDISPTLDNILGEDGIKGITENIAPVDGDIKNIKDSVTGQTKALAEYLKNHEIDLKSENELKERTKVLYGNESTNGSFAWYFSEFNKKLAEINTRLAMIDAGSLAASSITKLANQATSGLGYQIASSAVTSSIATGIGIVNALARTKKKAKGGHINNDMLAWTQEYGLEAILRPTDNAILTPLKAGDSVLTAEATKNLWDFANNPLDFMKQNVGMTTVSKNAGVTFNNSIAPTIVVNGVSNATEFIRELQKNKQFESMIQDMTINQMNGGNPLAKMKYKF